MKNRSVNLSQKTLHIFDKLFDKLYGHALNPFYNTGTLAIFLLLIVIISGIYLFLFYSIAAPYESVTIIQERIFPDRVIRALHRYASDTTLVVIFIHFMRMFMEGKTFGPRTLSWISGFILLGFLFLSAFTGYILVWDQHALLLANAGAKLLDLIPIFNEMPSRIFSGETMLDNSFFFINLFMHISLPLIMALGIWIHTLRISRVPWLPSKKIYWNIVVILTIISVLYPLKLMPKANFLQRPKHIPIDWFYGFWLPASNTLNPFVFLIICLVLVSIFISAPLWRRPKHLIRKEKATSNKDFCKACEQCTKDCPYHAISMTKITNNNNPKKIAKIDSTLCVSCGLCASSCDLLHLGPTLKKAVYQIKNAKKIIKTDNIDKNSVIFIYCSSSTPEKNKIKSIVNTDPHFKFYFYKQDCIGSLHIKTLSIFINACTGIFIISCPSKACQNREGPELFKKKLRKIQKLQNKIHFLNSGTNDVKLIRQQKDDFLSYLKKDKPHPNITPLRPQRLKLINGLIVSILLCFIIAYIPNITYSFNNKNSILRLSWRLAGQKIETCKKFSNIELKKIPKHMRNPNGFCKSTPINYNLFLSIDNKIIIKKNYYSQGLKGDGAIFVLIDIPIKPGSKNVVIRFLPILKQSFNNDLQALSLAKLNLNQTLIFKPREIKLVSIDTVNNKLISS